MTSELDKLLAQDQRRLFWEDAVWQISENAARVCAGTNSAQGRRQENVPYPECVRVADYLLSEWDKRWMPEETP